MNTRDIQERLSQIRKEHEENGSNRLVSLSVHIWHDRLSYTCNYDGNSEHLAYGPASAALQWIEGQHAEFMKSKGKLPTDDPPIEIIDPEPAEV